MRKLAFSSVLAISLAACTTIPNATKDQLAQVEAGYGAAASIALGYRNACANKKIPPSCRPIVVQIQNADRYAYAQLRVARDFIKNNPTIDATAVFTTAQQAVAAFKSAADAANSGVP